jgi:hypothetical protein
MKKIAVCGCSFFTSSKTRYDLIKGSSWPSEFILDLEVAPILVRNELKSLNYIHYPHFMDMYAIEKK